MRGLVRAKVRCKLLLTGRQTAPPRNLGFSSCAVFVYPIFQAGAGVRNDDDNAPTDQHALRPATATQDAARVKCSLLYGGNAGRARIA